jgi:predicted enzyme related to lactoylglutathione lyase
VTDKVAAQPIANLLVIRSDDINRAAEFYRTIGMRFELHSHGRGPEHYASDAAGFVFEIYPKKDEMDATKRTRIDFKVEDVDGVVQMLREEKATILTEPTDTEWGRRAVVRDCDGHTVELVTPLDRRKMLADAER